VLVVAGRLVPPVEGSVGAGVEVGRVMTVQVWSGILSGGPPGEEFEPGPPLLPYEKLGPRPPEEKFDSSLP